MHCRHDYVSLRQCIFQCFTEALYEKKQSIMTYNTEFAKLQAQVETLELSSVEREACIAKYEALVMGIEGEVI